MFGMPIQKKIQRVQQQDKSSKVEEISKKFNNKKMQITTKKHLKNQRKNRKKKLFKKFIRKIMNMSVPPHLRQISYLNHC